MRTSSSPRLASILALSGTLAGVAALWAGCVGGGGGDGGGGVVYDDGPTYVEGGVWADGGGRGWYGHDRGAAYVHPTGRSRPEEHAPAQHAESRPAPAAAAHDSGGRPDDHHK